MEPDQIDMMNEHELRDELRKLIVRKWWCDKCGMAKKYCKCQNPTAGVDDLSEANSLDVFVGAGLE